MPACVGLGLDRRAAPGTASQLGPAGLHGPGEPVEHDLHAGQLLVAEVLGLVPHGAGLVVGVVEDALGHRVGLADDLGALHHALGLGPHLLHQRLGLPGALGQELLALAQEPAGLAQLVGQAVEGGAQEAGHLLARDDDRRGERHGLGAGEDVEHLADDRLGTDVLFGLVDF